MGILPCTAPLSLSDPWPSPGSQGNDAGCCEDERLLSREGWAPGTLAATVHSCLSPSGPSRGWALAPLRTTPPAKGAVSPSELLGRGYQMGAQRRRPLLALDARSRAATIMVLTCVCSLK